MNADGSGREVIFGRDRNPVNDEFGAVEPAVSADGRKIVFGFRREAAYDSLTDIWVMDSDGSAARRLLRSNRNDQFGDPAFTAKGRIIVAQFRHHGRRGEARVFTMDLDGKQRRTMLRLPQRMRPWVGWRSFAEPSLSTDGRRLLYLLDPGYEGTFFRGGYRSALRVLELSTKKGRKLSDYSLGGVFSPDGRRIAYSEVDPAGADDYCWNLGEPCSAFSRVRVVRSNGKGVRDLTSGVADERSPDWSADGRIVLQSSRGADRGTAETTEIWSVLPDGRCLTRLTNGSPASLAPAWSDPGEAASHPVACGAAPPGPQGDVKPGPSRVSGVERLWLGPEFGGLLLTGFSGWGDNSFYYGDCGLIPASACAHAVVVDSADVCENRGFTVAYLGFKGFQEQRGIPLMKSLKPGRETPPFTFGISGRTVFFIVGGTGVGDRRRQHRREVDRLRTVGSPLVGGDLPVPLIPAGEIRVMRRVKRIFDRTGSIARTAAATGRSGIFVRNNLRFAHRYDSTNYGTVNCAAGG